MVIIYKTGENYCSQTMSIVQTSRSSHRIQPYRYSGAWKEAENPPLPQETKIRALYNLRIGCILNQEVNLRTTYSMPEVDDLIGEEDESEPGDITCITIDETLSTETQREDLHFETF